MDVQIFQTRPPFARFETRAVEDRDASITQKRFVTKDVDFALVTPSGSRDVVEKIVSEWFEQCEQFIREERFPPQWLDYYRAQYKSWSDGKETPLDGLDVRNWSMIGPSVANNLISVGFRTVESVAEANEEGVSRMGIGGRATRDLARQWVTSNTGSAAEAKAEAQAATARMKELEAQVAELLAKQAAVQVPEEVPAAPTPSAPKKL